MFYLKLDVLEERSISLRAESRKNDCINMTYKFTYMESLQALFKGFFIL